MSNISTLTKLFFRVCMFLIALFINDSNPLMKLGKAQHEAASVSVHERALQLQSTGEMCAEARAVAGF